MTLVEWYPGTIRYVGVIDIDQATADTQTCEEFSAALERELAQVVLDLRASIMKGYLTNWERPA